MDNSLNTDMMSIDCVENKIASKGNQANPLSQFRAQRCGFWVGGDFAALLPDFLDEGYRPFGIVPGNVVADVLKVSFRENGE